MRRKARQASKPENRPRLWGRHAVAAALANPDRKIVRISITHDAAAEFDIAPDVPVTYADAADLGRLVPRDAPHQGIVADVERLPDMWLADLLDEAEDGADIVRIGDLVEHQQGSAVLRLVEEIGEPDVGQPLHVGDNALVRRITGHEPAQIGGVGVGYGHVRRDVELGGGIVRDRDAHDLALRIGEGRGHRVAAPQARAVFWLACLACFASHDPLNGGAGPPWQVACPNIAAVIERCVDSRRTFRH